MDLSGYRLLVTGGGTGIGRATALAAVRAGARVVVTGRRMEALEETGRLAQSEPGELGVTVGDVTTNSSVRTAVAASVETLGGLDGVVNAAGIVTIARSEEVTDEDFLEVLDTNLVGAFRVSREAAQYMLPAGRGSIVHLGSLAGVGGFPGRVAYSVSKHGITGLVRTLAAEWGPSGIRVNAVAPGFVQTPMTDRAIDRGLLDLPALEHRTPLRRRAAPAEMNGPILFLLSEASQFVTGEILMADGGWSAHGSLVNAYSDPRG